MVTVAALATQGHVEAQAVNPKTRESC